MTEKPFLYILVGIPGSGKSTWIRNNLSNDYIIASSDNYIEQKSKEYGLSYSQGFEKFIKDADHFCREQIRYTIGQKKNIVIDRTNLKKSSRQWILELADNEYVKIAVVFSTDTSEIQNRLEKRNKSGKIISQELLQKFLSSFQMPSKDEGFDEIITIK